VKQTQMSSEQFRAYLKTRNYKKPRKHRNKIVYVYEDGYVTSTKNEGHGIIKERFDSQKEYDRWSELKLLERAGEIGELRRQVPFELFPAFSDKEGVRHQAVNYKADFTYTEKGTEVVEDVKAYDVVRGKHLTTETFNLKWKILKAKYPDRVFRLY